jgi:hypothetical protein
MAKEEALLERWRELAPEQQQQVFDYMQAIHSHQLAAHLKNLLLDMLEREHPNYPVQIAAAVNESITTTEQLPAMNPNEFRSWLTQL